MTSIHRGAFSTWAVIGGVFVAGLLGGAAVRSMVGGGNLGPRLSAGEGQESARRSGERRSRNGSFDGSARFVRHLQKELALTPAQATTIGAILDERERETSALFETIRQPMRDALERTEDEIREVLTEDQRGKFDEVVKDGRRRFGNGTFRRRGPDGAPHPPRANDSVGR